MFIERNETRYTNAGQITGPGRFLILVQGARSAGLPIKAVVRKVTLRQLGHFMMGYARVGGQDLMLSGSYGCDGLLLTIKDDLYDALTVKLPDELVEAWNEGGGHNSAGREAPAMRKWALENLKELTKPVRIK